MDIICVVVLGDDMFFKDESQGQQVQGEQLGAQYGPLRRTMNTRGRRGRVFPHGEREGSV